MLISTHVLVGGLIGASLTERVTPSRKGVAVAGVLGLTSHLACDALPHWGLRGQVGPRDARFLRVAVPDGLIGLGLLGAVVMRAPRHQRGLMAAAALGACLPDSDKVGTLLTGSSPWPHWFDIWHGRIQRESPTRLPGDVAKAAVLAIVLFGRPAD